MVARRIGLWHRHCWNWLVGRESQQDDEDDFWVFPDEGWTALHWACDAGSVESVRLFLAHTQCSKEIVRKGEERRLEKIEVVGMRDGG